MSSMARVARHVPEPAETQIRGGSDRDRHDTASPSLPPGPRTPAFVQVLHLWLRPIPFLEACARRYGDCFTMRTPFPVHRGGIVVFSHPDAVKEIFTGEADDLRAGEDNVILEPVLGRHSLLLLDGARHLRERRLMMPPFHGERMQAYGETMCRIADRAIDSWPLGRSFPIHREMQAITLDVIVHTVFGMEGAGVARLRELLQRFVALAASPVILMPALQVDLGSLTSWGWMVRLKREIDAILFAEFARRRATSCAGEDVLSMLIAARDELGEPMSDTELRDEMMTLLLAGHETTATALAWTFHRILEHPHVYETIRAELRRVAGTGPIAPRHIPELAYLDATIKETMRRHPIIPEVGRRLQRPMRIGGRDLPAGAIATPAIYLTHHRPDLWPDPTRFDPGRFLGGRPSPYEFFPFGGGVRRCLGAAFATYEMKIVLAQVLSRLRLRSAPGYRPRVVRRSVTLAPSKGVPVIVEERSR